VQLVAPVGQKTSKSASD